MGRTVDFAKRRIAGYVVFWVVILFFVVVLYNGNQPTQASGLFILAVAATASFAYTRRMKRRQREARERAKAPTRR